MSRYVAAAATNQTLLQFVGDLGITGYPVTLFWWFKRDGFSNSPPVKFFNVHSTTSSAAWRYLATGGEGNDNSYVDVHSRQQNIVDAPSQVGPSTNLAWSAQSLRVTDGNTSGAVARADGTSVTNSNTGLGTWATNSSPRIFIGSRGNTGAKSVGYYAHIAVWNVALSDTSIANLEGGANPLDTASVSESTSNLVAYWPLTDTSLSDASGNAAGDLELAELGGNTIEFVTVTGSVAFDSDNPTVDAPPSGGGGFSYRPSLLLGTGA